MAGPARLPFRKRHRLTHARQFQAVYRARIAKPSGPLVVYALPNECPHPRLGLSVGRRVGGATVRNLVKRRLREAFRQLQHDLPRSATGGYDLVVNVKPHKPLALADYRRHLGEAAARAHRAWERRTQREGRTMSDDGQASEPG